MHVLHEGHFCQKEMSLGLGLREGLARQSSKTWTFANIVFHILSYISEAGKMMPPFIRQTVDTGREKKTDKPNKWTTPEGRLYQA